MSDHRRPDYVPEPARSLGGDGLCCGATPQNYNTEMSFYPGGSKKFCTRCGRSFDSKTGLQIKNWAWRRSEDGTMFVRIGA